ncbi:hypothetical protein GGR21_001618 [Dysgonomonas hofstadii]|uniref:Outer membrane protein beta-barrel domain-containing protein n=1 Tax=Dysgonomonas hofstadii TaxID=637886 RepID=A0A840CVA4_9BACT|nr:porin family protein [Dysgonomonas hofstadii]MBB4035723.1 hypothetical protein [Dysgonomonas hofstadii]
MSTFLKIFLTSCILIILSSGIEVKAQRKFITSDFFVGMNFAEMDIQNANRNKEPKLGMLIGFNLNFKLKNNFQIQTGLYVTKKGLRQKVHDETTDEAASLITISDTLRNWVGNYIQVPLCIGYEYYITKSLAVNLNIGVYAAYGYKGDFNQEYSSSYIYNGIRQNGAVTVDGERNLYMQNGWKRFDYGTIARVGLIYDIFTINLSYEYGLYNVNNNDVIFKNNPSMKNRNMALALGFRF